MVSATECEGVLCFLWSSYCCLLYTSINAAMKAASNESFGYNEDQIVSSDIVGMRFGSLFDSTQTMVLPLDNGTTEVQVVSWYDNENSYTSQMVRTIKHFGTLL